MFISHLGQQIVGQGCFKIMDAAFFVRLFPREGGCRI